jgi:hypothetical protein
MGYILNTTSPECLVEFWVQADIGGAHGFLCEVYNGLDCRRCALLKRAAVDMFVEVDRVLARYNVLQRRTPGLVELNEYLQITLALCEGTHLLLSLSLFIDVDFSPFL